MPIKRLKRRGPYGVRVRVDGFGLGLKGSD